MLRRTLALSASAALSAAVLCGAAAAHAQSKVDRIVDGIQKAYRSTENFRAVFKQTLRLRATKRTRNTGGKLYFQKPGKFRFSYKTGEKKEMVSDGKKVWTYMVEDAQVRVDPFSPKLASSLRFLWGGGNLKQDFDVKELPSSDLAKNGEHVLELTPKVDEGHFKKLVFVVDPKTFDVKQTVVHDPMGNINHMRFVRVQRNVDMKANTFKFKPPKGVQIVESPELKP